MASFGSTSKQSAKIVFSATSQKFPTIQFEHHLITGTFALGLLHFNNMAILSFTVIISMHNCGPFLHSFPLSLDLAEKDLLDITDYLLNMEKNHIYHLGLVLGLTQTKLKAMKDSDTFLDDVIAAWLRKEDNVKEKGEPSWTVLISALKHRRVGQAGIADDIAKDKGVPQ